MKLTRTQKRLIILGIGLLFIVFGALQAIFKFKVNKGMTDQISFWLMVGAVMLLFSKDQPEPAKPEESQNPTVSEKNTSETEK